MSKKKRIIFAVLTFGVLMLIWYLFTDVLGLIPALKLPGPTKVFQTFVKKFTVKKPDGATLPVHTWSSLKVALLGFGFGTVIGIPLGIAMAWWHRADLIIKPIFNLIRPIPPLAWIPLMILWIGIGTTSKAIIIFVSAFIPCVINAYSGIKQTSPVHMWVAQTFGASRNRILFTVAIPTALPSIFTGMRLSLSMAWTSLVAAEMLASNSGLGFMIQVSRMMARIDIIIVGLITIGLIGAVMSGLLSLLERKLVSVWN